MRKKMLVIFIMMSTVTTLAPSVFSVEIENKNIIVYLSECGITDERLLEMVINNEISSNVTNLYLLGNQITDISPLSKLINLKVLDLSCNKIDDLNPLSSLINLRQLYLTDNQITDISPLSELLNLESLDLDDNRISNIFPLSSLTNLGGSYGTLILSRNQITDITPLSNLTKLEWLDLRYNQITDFTPLESLTNLTFVTLHDNPATDEHIAEVRANMKKFSTFVNRVLGNEPVTINEALEILMYLAGMESSIISEGNVAFYAARITGGETPTIMDALEILMHLAGLESAYG
jgi:hypothetical protein